MPMIDGVKIDPTLFPKRHTSPAGQGRRYPARSSQARAPSRAVHSPSPALITQLAALPSLSPAIQPSDHPALVCRLPHHSPRLHSFFTEFSFLFHFAVCFLSFFHVFIRFSMFVVSFLFFFEFLPIFHPVFKVCS